MTIKHAVLASLILLGGLVVLAVAAFLRDADARATGRFVGNLFCYGLAGIWFGYFMTRKSGNTKGSE